MTRHVTKAQERNGCIRWQDGNSVPPKCRQQKRRPWIWRFDISHRPPAPPAQLRLVRERPRRDVPRHKPHLVPAVAKCGEAPSSQCVSILLDRLPPSQLDAFRFRFRDVQCKRCNANKQTISRSVTDGHGQLIQVATSFPCHGCSFQLRCAPRAVGPRHTQSTAFGE